MVLTGRAGFCLASAMGLCNTQAFVCNKVASCLSSRRRKDIFSRGAGRQAAGGPAAFAVRGRRGRLTSCHVHGPGTPGSRGDKRPVRHCRTGRLSFRPDRLFSFAPFTYPSRLWPSRPPQTARGSGGIIPPAGPGSARRVQGGALPGAGQRPAALPTCRRRRRRLFCGAGIRSRRAAPR